MRVVRFFRRREVWTRAFVLLATFAIIDAAVRVALGRPLPYMARGVLIVWAVIGLCEMYDDLWPSRRWHPDDEVDLSSVIAAAQETLEAMEELGGDIAAYMEESVIGYDRDPEKVLAGVDAVARSAIARHLGVAPDRVRLFNLRATEQGVAFDGYEVEGE